MALFTFLEKTSSHLYSQAPNLSNIHFQSQTEKSAFIVHIFPISAPALFASDESAFNHFMAVFIGISNRFTVVFTIHNTVFAIAEALDTKALFIFSVVVLVSSLIQLIIALYESYSDWNVPCTSHIVDINSVDIKAPIYSHSHVCVFTESSVAPVIALRVSINIFFILSVTTVRKSTSVDIASATYCIVGSISWNAVLSQFTIYFNHSHTINNPLT